MNPKYYIQKSARVCALASKGNPVTGCFTVVMFWAMAQMLEAMIEKIIWGETFLHWFDPVMTVAFIAYAGAVVWECARLKILTIEGRDGVPNE